MKGSVNYLGIFFMLLIAAILGGVTNWLLLQYMPPEILTRINGRVNNNEIRLERIENQVRNSQ